MAMLVSSCDRAASQSLLPLEGSLGVWEPGVSIVPCLDQFVCTVILPRTDGPDAAFSLCHTHSAITFGPGGGEEGGEQNLKKRP